jgi:hypothetical protein
MATPYHTKEASYENFKLLGMEMKATFEKWQPEAAMGEVFFVT